mgnify:CR=1 FL=1
MWEMRIPSASGGCERIAGGGAGSMPEAQIILANAVTYVACAPKSNAAVCAIDAAMRCVQETGNLPGAPAPAGCPL